MKSLEGGSGGGGGNLWRYRNHGNEQRALAGPKSYEVGFGVTHYIDPMAAYNDKTIKGMFIFCSRKIQIPGADPQLHCIEWNHNTNFIAVGGANGTLKIIRLAALDHGYNIAMRAEKSSTQHNLQINQDLDGHSNGTIKCASWNEMYQKLTTSDSNGLIIVWSRHMDSWYEEMINNRNKSTVVGMCWNNEGSRIAIAYGDGQVIVGTMDGNRIWNKELQAQLTACAWSPDGQLLLFGMENGEVHAYDLLGNFVHKLPMTALENVELEAALAKDLRKDTIKSLKWYAPAPRAKNAETITVRKEKVGKKKLKRLPSMEPSVVASEQRVDNRPRLLVAYEHGVIQLMRNENDANAIVVRFDSLTLHSAEWSPNGAFFAITGTQMDLPAGDQNYVIFLTAMGVQLNRLKVQGNTLASCSWDPTGLRVAITVDTHVFFANIRPDYLWGYCGQTVIYSYEKDDPGEFRVVFYETKLEECYAKPVRNLENIASYEDYCIIVNKTEDGGGTYLVQLCNGIGTPVDFKYVDVEPKNVALNNSAAVIAGSESFFIWHFTVPKKTALPMNLQQQPPNKEDTVHFLEPGSIHSDIGISRRRRAADGFCALSMADTFFLAACDSGILFKFALADGTQLSRLTFTPNISKMALNCTFRRLAAVNKEGVLSFWDLTDDAIKYMPGLDRNDAWSFQWDSEKDDTIAVTEKLKLIIIRGRDAEDGIVSAGYICSFKGLTVRTAMVDQFLLQPDNPEKKFIMDIEIKSLRDAKYLLEKMKIQEANAYIEKNPHPKLWSLLAQVALNKLDIPTAEHAYVMLGDFAGLQFCKRVVLIQQLELRKAEIAAHLGKHDDAERLYIEADRRDLAIDMRRRMNDWFRILQILQTSSGPGDDVLLHLAYNKVGDFYSERSKWALAARHYEQSRNNERLVHCYIALDDFMNLQILAKTLPDGHPLLGTIADLFGSAGMWEPAVDSYLRCEMVNDALDVCIQLNQWEKAVSLSKTHKLRDVTSLLGRYAKELTGSNERTLAAVQLYRRAGKYLDAARIVFEIAEDERRKSSSLLRLKKLYVLGALMIEEYNDHNRAKATEGVKENGLSVTDRETKAALSGLMNGDSAVSIDDSKLIDEAWRGAVAYHFFMMAQRHLYEGNIEGAMKTALILTEYDDLVDAVELYALLALSSCAARQFSVCSRAFMKLDSLPDLTDDEKESYRKLAMKIFTKYPPQDNRIDKTECTNCQKKFAEYTTECPECSNKIPFCIASGKPLEDYSFWLCPVCHHKAYEKVMRTQKFCPLCHSDDV